MTDFSLKHPSVREPLLVWYRTVLTKNWQNPNDVKNDFRAASFIGGNRIVFNIKGNEYRLIVKVNFDYGIIFIIWIGTHADYDKIDAEKVRYDG
ncbi:MAG: type II toxin-antitoxin system HigB family toxin [Candidatus Symbiobacter sp.]|nr:type II toxin-antitoxin system HigB family toxin [Candidatus Symbiobacter sp.]